MKTGKMWLFTLAALVLAGCAGGASRYDYYGKHDCQYYGNCDQGGYYG